MADTVISVDNLSKRYVLSHLNGKGDGLRHKIEELAQAPFQWFKTRLKNGQNGHIAQPRSSGQREEFWALKNVSFEIKRGEVVGIIGRNGAGKSTLLKLLSRIIEPTEGEIILNGRVASLLEVGTGFHPELTGRENIFLNGAILGMTKQEIKQKFDEIVAFAEIEKFLDTPVKRYSSGMYVRLAFAVAAHLEPEILVVDEVLAVGDAEFQKKCLGKMRDVSRQEGRTVLFVSHNLAAVLQLTNSGIVLEKGRMIFRGPTEEAVAAYTSSDALKQAVVFDVEREPRKYIGTQDAKFVSLRFDRSAPLFAFGEPFRFTAVVRAVNDVSRLRFSMTIFTAEGMPVGSSFSNECGWARHGEKIEVDLTLANLRLAPGRYYCGVAVGRGNNRTGLVDFDAVLDTLPFEIRPEEGDGGTVATWVRNWGSTVFPEIEATRAAASNEQTEVHFT